MKRTVAFLAIISFLTLPGASGQSPGLSPKQPPPNYPWDNCSWFPDGDYADCCVAHDKEYFVGGTKAERKAADKRLQQCVRAKGHKYLSKMMYWGVRIGGVPWLPTPFRWGFGQPKK